MGTTVLFDKGGNRVEVPDDQVTSKLVSGELGTDKTSVNVQTSAGKVYTLPTANLGKFAAAQPGLRVMSDGDLAAHEAKKQEAQNQADYGGAGAQAHVALMSGLSGLTLGGSDYLAGKVLSDEQKRTLEHEKEANPTTNIGASIAGALLPTIASGGSAAPEEAALLGGRELAAAGSVAREASTAEKLIDAAKGLVTAPARGVEAGANLAERGTNAGIKALLGGDATSFAGQVAQRALTKAAGGAVTGGLATGAMEIGENELSTDHQLTGEQLLHDMTLGALLGGGLGGVGGAASRTLERVLAPSESGDGAIRNMLRKQANEWEVDATGAKTKEINKLEKNGITKDDVGQWMHDNLSKYTEDGGHPITREAKLEAAGKAIEDAQPKIGAHIDVLDQAGLKPDWGPVVDRLRGEVVEPLMKSVDPRVQNVGSTIGKLVDNAETKLGADPTYRQMFDLRREIDKSINFNKADMSQVTTNTEMRAARRVIEDEIGKQGRHALGEEWGRGYDEAKRQFRMGTLVSETLESADKRIGTHEPLSLTSTILGAHGMGVAAMGHPMGLLAGASAMIGNHVLKTYGKAVGSRALNALLQTNALETTIQPMVSARAVVQAQRSYANAVARGMAALTSGEVAANPVGRPKTLEGSFAEKSKMVQAMASNPAYGQALQQHAHAMGSQFATVGSAYQLSGMKSMAYLASQVPKERPIDPAQPAAGTIKPSDAEKARFVRQFDAVEDPTSLLHAAGKGVLTRDMIDAVAFAKPETLKDLQSKVTAQLKTLKEPLAPPQAAAVKMILGQPVFDRPIAPMPQPKVTTAGGGTKGNKPFKGALSSATALHGNAVGSTHGT